MVTPGLSDVPSQWWPTLCSPQAPEDAMRLHVDDSDHGLRAPIQLLGGIRNVPWIARGSVYKYIIQQINKPIYELWNVFLTMS